MQIQRLVDLEDYEFDTLLVTYNHKILVVRDTVFA